MHVDTLLTFFRYLLPTSSAAKTISFPPIVPVLPLTPNVNAYPGGSSLPGGGSSSSGHEAGAGFCSTISTYLSACRIMTSALHTLVDKIRKVLVSGSIGP